MSTSTTYRRSKIESAPRIRYLLEQLRLGNQPRRRVSAVELRMRQRFNRLMREKTSKTGPSQINENKIEDDWIDWMLIWKTATSIRQNRAGVVEEHMKIDPRALVLLKQAFLRRSELGWRKRNEFLSSEDAVIRIQMSFRAYLKKKSQVPQALRDLAVTNTELKKIGCSFKVSSYRDRLARDPEENQRFAEKIIVVLLTVYGIEGANPKIRVAKKLMVDEIEKMLYKVRGRQSQNFVASIKDFLPLSEPTFEPARIRMANWHRIFKDLLPLSEPTFEPARIRMANWHRIFKDLLPLPDNGETSTVDLIRKFQLAKRPRVIKARTFELGRSARRPRPAKRSRPDKLACLWMNDISNSDYEDVQNDISDSDYEDVQNEISNSGWLPPMAAVIKIQRNFRAYLMRRSQARQKIQRTIRAYLRRSLAVQKIQRTIRAYLMRKSQALQAYRKLALVETKLGEIRFLFNDLSYRHRVARDAEEHQRFAEKVIVLLLTVDAIEGTNEMIRSFKKSMVDELEAMLDVIDNRGIRGKKFAASMEPMLEKKDEEATDHGSVLLRRAFLRRVGKGKEKRNELSPVDAAIKIQRSYRDYRVTKSQALQAYRDLAVVRTKLKEIECLFNDFSFRRRVARDAKERQKFVEKIIVLILTADGIVGVNVMIRGSKNCVVNELEAMLDVVDPQPPATDLRRS